MVAHCGPGRHYLDRYGGTDYGQTDRVLVLFIILAKASRHFDSWEWTFPLETLQNLLESILL